MQLDNKSIGKNLIDNIGKNLIGYVPQEIFMLDDTIKANIVFAEKNINYKRLDYVLDVSGLNNFVSSLKKGLKTNVGERGIKLSGGQKQRIGVARALYQEKKILILDEPTSSLDRHTEKKFLKLLFQMKKKGLTIIIVSHRQNIFKSFDITYELKDGKLKKID